ncbi:MAG: GreA/GreB family elongation factor [Parachlamydiaceae bacterium]
MGYLNEFKTQIANRDFAKFLELWEEYCTCDTADFEELNSLLTAIKASDFAKPFGAYAEWIIPQWETMQNPQEAYDVFKALIELQTTNSTKLADIALRLLEEKYKNNPTFSEKVRLVGLRTKENFQNALNNFDLLIHAQKGNFVFHSSGWGAGEIMDVSPVRELLMVEFENVPGIKQITFANAFKSIAPLPNEHFLARRFADPDKLEKEAKENPVEVVKCLLRDLGPKTGSELKDELAELVIPESEWQKWWQNTRAKLKKDTEIICPENSKEPFSLRKEAVSHEALFLDSLKKKKSEQETLNTCYNFIRDYLSLAKKPDVQTALKENLEGVLHSKHPKTAHLLQALFCLEALQPGTQEQHISSYISGEKDLPSLIDQIEIAAHKKQALQYLKKSRTDWPQIFQSLLPKISTGLVREYLIKELVSEGKQNLIQELIQSLLAHSEREPEFFFWYFQKVVNKETDLPLSGKDDLYQLAESSLTLLHAIENQPEHKDLIKRIYVLWTNHRYKLLRDLLQDCPIAFAKEFLLLASKCHTFTTTDIKSFHALAAVVHTSLGKNEKKQKTDVHTFWVTEKGYEEIQEKAKRIATKEVIENARDVEAARALGDLRENSEYKSAVEKRAHLQRELKALSEHISKARIITPDDISDEEVGVGSKVEVQGQDGNKISYTILGPWEANADKNILSVQSKFAQAMMGLRIGDTFSVKDEEYTILSFRSIFG